MADEDGASPRELLLEAARRDNTELLQEVLKKNNDPKFLNEATDALGNTAVHLAAQYGSYDVLDALLDCEGLEIDPHTKLDQDTPLHLAVALSARDKQLGHAIVELLLDAGADPRVRNKHKNRPVDVVDPRDDELRKVLQTAEYKMSMAGDVVEEDDGEAGEGEGSDSE